MNAHARNFRGTKPRRLVLVSSFDPDGILHDIASWELEDREPSLGWPEQVDQERRVIETRNWHVDDGEEDAGDMPELVCEDEGAQCEGEGEEEGF